MEGDMITFKDMSFKKKAEHIWEYYKLHIIGTIIMIGVVFSLLNHYILNPPPDLYAGLGFYHNYISDNKIVLLSNVLSEELVEEGVNEAVSIYTFYTNELDVMAEVESDQRFQLLYMSEDLDVVIGEEEAFKTMAYAGYVGELENFLSGEEIKKFDEEERIIQCDNEMTEVFQNYGVRLDNSTIIELVPDLQGKDLYIGFARNTKRTEKAKKLFYEMLDTEKVRKTETVK